MAGFWKYETIVACFKAEILTYIRMNCMKYSEYNIITCILSSSFVTNRKFYGLEKCFVLLCFSCDGFGNLSCTMIDQLLRLQKYFTFD